MLALIFTSRIDLIDAAILSLPGVLAFVSSVWIHRKIKVPSGGKIGVVVDHTHSLAAGTSAATTKILKQQNGQVDAEAAPGAAKTPGGGVG